MKALWWAEAERYGVLPIATGDLTRLLARRPSVGGNQKVVELFAGGAPLPFTGAPRVYNRAHAVTARVVVPDGGAEGVLVTHGNRHGGYSLYLADGHLHYVHNYLGMDRFTVTSSGAGPGRGVDAAHGVPPHRRARLLQGSRQPGRGPVVPR